MQILVIWRVKPEVDIKKELLPLMEAEEHYAWADYMRGRLRQFFLTEIPGLVVMILEYPSLEEAKKSYDELPILKAGLMAPEFHELRPFQSWEYLFKEEHKMKNRK